MTLILKPNEEVMLLADLLFVLFLIFLNWILNCNN